MDLYSKMGEELRSLFNDLFDPTCARTLRQKMARIVAIARQIGGSIKDEAEQLNNDLLNFLNSPNDPTFISIMKEHALKLEQETREI
jgi:hypothetical protein